MTMNTPAAKAPSIHEWLSSAIECSATRVDLCEWRGGNPGSRVRSWPLAANLDQDKAAAQMRASADADGAAQAGQKATYVLLAYRDAEQIDRCFVQVLGSNARALGITEDVHDLPGVVAQLMRANNELATIVVRATQGRDDAYMRQIEQLSTALERSSAMNAAMMAEHQKTILFQQEQERLRIEAARIDRRDAWVMEKLSLLGPVIVNRLMGGGPGKGAPAADAMLAAVFESLTPDEVQAFATLAISDEKKAMFIELYMAYAKRAETRRALNADATNGTNGEARP
jgi:hypothetical protein